jgi:hypothetical protein
MSIDVEPVTAVACLLLMPRRVLVRFPTILCAFLLACSDPSESQPEPEPEPEPEPSDVSTEVGIPAGDDGLDFAPLEDGAELRLQTFGQGGTHLFLGVRCIGFGSRAYVTVTLKNLTSGIEVTSPAPPRPQLLFCNEDEPRVCDLVPMTVMTGGLTERSDDRDGLRIRVGADVHNDDGLRAYASVEAVLSTADL